MFSSPVPLAVLQCTMLAQRFRWLPLWAEIAGPSLRDYLTMMKRQQMGSAKGCGGFGSVAVPGANTDAPIKSQTNATTGLSRRQALHLAAMTAITIVPRHVLGGPGQKPPSETLGVAVIGCANQGKGNPIAATNGRLVALCDVDEGFLAQSLKDVKPPSRA